MKFSLKWINRYTKLPLGNLEELNSIIDRIALQVVDVDERWVNETDAIIDIDNKIITNRPYAFGHRGLAREIAVMLSQPWSGGEYPSLPGEEMRRIPQIPVKVTVEAPELCPRFTALAISGVDIGPSPDYLKEAIESVGLRSINNLVDITNLIMLDTAQPVHAYDLNKIKDAHLIIRRAHESERVTTLDGVERILNNNVLVITDPEKVVGIGGVMGAGNSEIDDNTTDILLEIAHFQPINIRQTAKLLKHRTDAATRYEKGVDPTNIPNVMAFMVELILEICGGEVVSDYIDVNNLEFSTLRTKPMTMNFDPKRVDKLLGFGIKEEEIRRIIDGFGITIQEERERNWVLQIPTYRPDIKEPADIIEDVGRMFGYQNIPEITPINKLIVPSRNSKVIALRKIKNALTSSGLDEVITYPFIADKDIDAFGITDAISLVNPLSNEYKYLRTTLIPSLSKVSGLNAKYFDTFGIFEVARKFIKKTSEELPYETDHGESMQPHEIELISMMYYAKAEREGSIFNLKAAFENLMISLGILSARYEILSDGTIKLDKRTIGKIGLLTAQQLKQYELDYPTSYLEIELEPLLNCMVDTRKVKPFSKHQGTSLDYSILLPKSIPVQKIIEVIPEHSWIISKSIIDVYTGLKETSEKKSVTVRLSLQKDDGSITASEVYDLAQEIEKGIKEIDGVEIRGGGVVKPAQYIPSVISKNNSLDIPATIAPDNKIVVGKIIEIIQHPNADKLVITKVDVGNAKPENTLFNDYLQIVTGAKNIAVGNYIPVALPGAVIPGIVDENGKNLVIKKGNLRGERSEGMMCSKRELGQGEDHTGIWILDEAEYKGKIGNTFIY